MTSRRLLIVEDEAIVAHDLAEQLGEMGYDICGVADNGPQALEMARTHRPNLVLMDVVIKGPMDGIKTAAMMHQEHDAAIVFLTAYSDSDTVRRATDTAPYGFLTKPYQINEIKAALEIAAYKFAMERELKESEQWFSSMLRCVTDAIIATDRTGAVRFINSRAEALFGRSLDQLADTSVSSLLTFSTSNGEARSIELADILDDHGCAHIEFNQQLILDAPRTCLTVDYAVAPIRSTLDGLDGLLISLRDVSERLNVEQTLRSSEESFRTAFDFAPTGMALVGMDGRFLQGNHAICRLLGHSASTLVNQLQRDVSLPEDMAEEERQLLNLFIEGITSVQFEKRYINHAGQPVWTLVSVSLLRKSDIPVCYLYQVHDLSLRKEYELHLARQANSDSLTGLPNRSALMTELNRLIVGSRRRQSKFALLFIDIDHFKQVNDTWGHDAGDQFISEVGRHLSSLVRASDFVARLGGDEFIILLSELTDASQIKPVVRKLLNHFAQPLTVGKLSIPCSISIGISMYPDDSEEPARLMQYADNALYQVKAEGRGSSQFYARELTDHLRQRLSLDDELERAVAQEEFELFYQPIVPLEARLPIKAEALIRWRHPVRGLVGAHEFINHLEDSGLIVDLGRWIIKEACRQAATWPMTNNLAPGVCINVSARQFRFDDLAKTVTEALDETGLTPERLCIEITEKLLMIDSERTLCTINELKALGVEIAIDDFGIGYSSLSYIRRFKPDKLKIDREFVMGISNSEFDERLLSAIIAMGDQLRIAIVAEGVETLEQRDYLKGQHCGYIQGFFYAKPMEESSFRQWLIQNGPDIIRDQIPLAD
ncbi:two-component system response regulator [Larsenimonas rhizosphaerae]|uniref:two-component system response regulator n=1 Tax=Larsenimonas rhizosphaerae TaxID=2944682 RepID=UPI0020347256|nr:EAL domain-containing protein [Larsenimonas rhizosphaerae]MCM2131909.1 EAL domain-containing protein [Larsenimonas rhizosphaerae]